MHVPLICPAARVGTVSVTDPHPPPGTSPSATPGSPSGRGRWLGLLLTAIGPFVVYQALTRGGAPPAPALAAAAVLPLLGTARGWVRTGRPDAIGLLALLFLGLGIAVAAATAAARVVLHQGALFNAVSGLLCFGSLLWARPLLFYVGRQFTAGDDPGALAWYDALWGGPAFRTSQRVLTVAWGAWGLAQAAIRAGLTAALPVATVRAVWPLLDLLVILVTVLLVAWSISYSRRAAQPA